MMPREMAKNRCITIQDAQRIIDEAAQAPIP